MNPQFFLPTLHTPDIYDILSHRKFLKIYFHSIFGGFENGLVKYIRVSVGLHAEVYRMK